MIPLHPGVVHLVPFSFTVLSVDTFIVPHFGQCTAGFPYFGIIYIRFWKLGYLYPSLIFYDDSVFPIALSGRTLL